MRELNTEEIHQISGAWCPWCLLAWTLLALNSGAVKLKERQKEILLIVAASAIMASGYVLG